MKNLTKVNKEIEKYQKQLEKSPIVENFGQKFVLKLRDKYPLDYSKESLMIHQAIDWFNNWCMNFTN